MVGTARPPTTNAGGRLGDRAKRKAHAWYHAWASEEPGNALLSHSLAAAVSSALEGLTSVFGMGTGVAPPAWSPGICAWGHVYQK